MIDSQDVLLNTNMEEAKQHGNAAEPSVNNEQVEVAILSTDETIGDKVEAQESKTEDAATPLKNYTSKKEIVARVKEISASEETPSKAEIDHLKTLFYKIHFTEREEQQKAFLANGGKPEEYQVFPDEEEESFKAEMAIIKEKRQKAFLEQEALKQDNLKKKEAIIEKIKAMVTTPEEADKNFQEFKTLQQEWKNIKPVPAEKNNELWSNYQLYVEQFYDLFNLNREAREYDFKKNLKKKTELCEAAEKLADETDVVSAFHQLQELHSEYRETGPVEKELREEIWARFKAASSVVNKRHQQHFEELRAKEEENLVKKTALCEQVEAILERELNGSSVWEKATKEIIAIQQEWKTIGFAPQKMNVKIFERFRAACDKFFARKATFFQTLKETFAENAEKKRALLEKAKELSNSTDWNATSNKLIALQREWKTVGMVPKKIGDQLWNDFVEACNHFFEARNAVQADSKMAEQDNLKKKYEIIEQLQAIDPSDDEQAREELQRLSDEYAKVGHVPYKEKDKVYQAYYEVRDKLHKALNINASKRRVDNFKNNLKKVASRGENALDNERGRLMHRLDQLKQEINTYENNIGFLNISSKKGNSLVEDMKRRVQKLKDDVEEIKLKIKAIDAENKD